jgi:hypothetical protein
MISEMVLVLLGLMSFSQMVMASIKMTVACLPQRTQYSYLSNLAPLGLGYLQFIIVGNLT